MQGPKDFDKDIATREIFHGILDYRRQGGGIQATYHNEIIRKWFDCVRYVHAKSRKTTEHTTKETFADFSSRYISIEPNQDGSIRSKIKLLDPRLSEVAVQVFAPLSSPVVSMLPSLLDDPDKASAWKVSQPLRVFVYSLLRMDSGCKDMKLIEYTDRTQVKTKGRSLDLLDNPDSIKTADRLLSMLRSIRKSFGDAHCSITYWQTVCYIQVTYHNIASTPGTIKHLPGLLHKILKRELSRQTWSELHFQAQFEATYYAFRQLSQTLHYLVSEDIQAEHNLFSDLKKAMIGFPGIAEMFAGQSQAVVVQVDARYIFKFASQMLDNQQ